MSMLPSFDWPAGRLWQRRLLIAGGVGAAACALAALLNVEQFLRSYLFAYFCSLGIAVGSLGLWLLHNLTGGAWGFALRRIWEAVTRTLPVLAALFLPIALGVYVLFPWSKMDAHELGPKAAYLNVPFFLVRAAAYFATWIGLAYFFNRWSAEYDRRGDVRFVHSAQHWSGPGLPFLGLTVTFAAIDWLMSLEPEWSSTIFGALIAAGFLLAGLAFAIALTTLTAPPHGTEEETKNRWNDLGNLLLAFVMVWTYLELSQFLLIWSGNLPEEITWYLHRSEGGWQWIALFLAGGYFVLPFGMLLSSANKRRPERLRVVALLVVGMSVVHQFWLIAPTFSPGHFHIHWADVAALVAVGGLWGAAFLHQVQARPIAPVREQAFAEEVQHA
jgi:hypothetical protein